MNPFKCSGPILVFCMLPLASTAAFTSAEKPFNRQPDHPTNDVVHLLVRTFPEPCGDECTLVVPDGMRGNTRATLLDGSYRTVRDWPLGFSETAGNRVDLQLNGLEPGTYTLRVWDEYGDAGAAIIEHQ